MSYAAAIRTRGLSKDYGEGHGLFDLDLEVERGEIFGFLGPNGAGKSTTMRLLLDLIAPTAGSATLMDLERGYVAELRGGVDSAFATRSPRGSTPTCAGRSGSCRRATARSWG